MTELPANGVVALAKSQPEPCSHCGDEGVLRWTQPVPGPDGLILREMEHPCPAGCGDTWKHPAAEADRVIDTPSNTPHRTRGHADAANEIGVDFIQQMIDQR